MPSLDRTRTSWRQRGAAQPLVDEGGPRPVRPCAVVPAERTEGERTLPSTEADSPNAGAITVITERARWPSPSLMCWVRTGRLAAVTSSAGTGSIAAASAGDEPTTGCWTLDTEAATKIKESKSQNEGAPTRVTEASHAASVDAWYGLSKGCSFRPRLA
jgi:hypothetical protein